MLKRGFSECVKLRSSHNPAKYRKVSVSKPTISQLSSVFLTNPCKVSCVYLIKTDLFTYDKNTEYVFKYGYTNDIIRRSLEHQVKYGDDIELWCHVPVPGVFLRDAEKDVKQYFIEAGWTYILDGYNEIVRIPIEETGNVMDFYKGVAEKYNKQYEVALIENRLFHKVMKIKN